jgi:NADH-quinone oxidoreductase subunit A
VTEFLPILVFLAAILGFAAFNLVAPHVVAPRKSTPVKDMPYESGMDPIGSTRNPVSIKFYLIAILFVVFDVELLYLYPWAVALGSEADYGARLAQLAVMLSLVASVVLAYLYAWRKGVFEWRSK